MGTKPAPAILPELEWRESPNQSQRLHAEHGVTLIVCHTPEGSYESAIATVLDEDREACYHVLADNENPRRGTQFVRWSRKAWHAGYVNSRSDGLALAGHARKFRSLSPGGRVFARMVAKRCQERGIPPRWTRKPNRPGVTRHADVDPTRRSDPTPSVARWLVFIGLVKFEYRRGRFRRRWGRD